LTQGQILPVAECHNLIKSREQLEGVLEDFPLVQRLAYRGDNLREEVERVYVLEDIRLEVGDEHHEQLVERLIDVAHIVLLDRGMLRSSVGELWEGGEERFDARTLHLSELAREHGFPAAGTY